MPTGPSQNYTHEHKHILEQWELGCVSADLCLLSLPSIAHIICIVFIYTSLSQLDTFESIQIPQFFIYLCA